MNNEELKKIEECENHYLNKYYHFLKFAEDEILTGLKTCEKIKNDWYGLYSKGISTYSVGAERIIYSLLNGKGIGEPNSAPVGADLFFELEDTYIHLDLKTVGATLNPRDKNHPDGTWSNNISDYYKDIFVGKNQNSYSSEIRKANGTSYDPERKYDAQLPTHYNEGTDDEKLCLSFFITILYDRDSLNVLVLSIISMPNGKLEEHYKARPLNAGKNLEKARFNFTEVNKFELLDDSPKRIRVVYFDKDMDSSYIDKLDFFENIYDSQ